MYASVRVRKHVCLYLCIYTYIHPYIGTCIHAHTHTHIYASPLKDPRVLALFGRNPLNHDSRVLVLFGKNPLKYDSINPKEPLHSTALPGNPGYPHQLQYHVYAVCVNPYVCLYAYGTRVMDTKHKLSEGGIYEYKRARLQRQRHCGALTSVDRGHGTKGRHNDRDGDDDVDEDNDYAGAEDEDVDGDVDHEDDDEF